MNIVTKALAKEILDQRLLAWIAHWDALEELVIRVYKGKAASAEDEAEWKRLRRWLIKEYLHWEPTLRPYWQQTRVAGKLVKEDPYSKLLSFRRAGEFIGNWTAMQILPATREALNQLLLDIKENRFA